MRRVQSTKRLARPTGEAHLPKSPAARDGVHAKLGPVLALRFRILAAVRNTSLNQAMIDACAAYVAAATAEEQTACQLGIAPPAAQAD